MAIPRPNGREEQPVRYTPGRVSRTQLGLPRSLCPSLSAAATFPESAYLPLPGHRQALRMGARAQVWAC